jgi:hypothetical protein
MRRNELMIRRQRLLADIADQRVQLAELGEQLQPALRYGDRVRALLGFVRGHVVLIGAVAALFLVRRNGLSVMLRSGWRIWKIYRYVKGVSARLLV